MGKKFYITTAIPYVNAKPHLGHALEFVQTDTIARHHKMLGDDVYVLSGGDENALKNVQAAQIAQTPIQKFIDTNAELFQNLAIKLNIHFDVFQKGSDRTHHYVSSQKLWALCKKSGDIYKKPYEGLYCVGCETFYNPDELDKKGECMEHPGKKLDKVSEENYFFKLSKYQIKLIDLITNDEIKIIPNSRRNEVLSFLKQPLKDISISRSNERAKQWGVPVLEDKTQRIYVWFDALNIYQSGVGFGWDDKKYKYWWPADVHVIGKGIIRFHAVYWPAFLLSAGLKLPKTLFVHGYFTINGQKMSKTLGNIIDPIELINKYGTDPLRYYFLREIPAYSDGDFSERRFIELYNADLANGLGNLISRVAKLSQNVTFSQKDSITLESNLIHKEFTNTTDFKRFNNLMFNFKFNEVLELIWKKVTMLNRYIDKNEPWKLNGEKLSNVLTHSISSIQEIAYLLTPLLPETAKKISYQFSFKELKLKPPLFPRLK